MEQLIEVLGKPDAIAQEDGETVWKWFKGYDQNGQVLHFTVGTFNDSEYMYDYTADDDTEIHDYAELDEIIEYAKEFVKYVRVAKVR